MIAKIIARNLSYRKARTFLTLLGIIIGITAVVSLISIGSGMKKAINDQFEQLGADKISVVSLRVAGASSKGFTDKDVEEIRKIPGVKAVTPIYGITVGSEFKGVVKPITIWGVPVKDAEKTFSDARSFRILRGRWLKEGDKKKAVLGYKVHDSYYGKKVDIGEKIKIQDEEVEIVGIFAETGARERDEKMIMDIDFLRSITNAGDRVTGIVVQAENEKNIEELSLRIKRKLEKTHEKGTFEVLTLQQLADKIASSFTIVQIVFGGIAGVSILVGGIGIANTMLMSVMERRRDIGVFKATGASNMHILKVIVAESGILGAIGGSIGLALGYAISKMINIAGERTLGSNVLVTHISFELAAFALLFSFIIGAISGIYPAYLATKQNPVEVLRT